MEKDYEKFGIKISIAGSVLLSLSAIVMALLAKSQAILLDGLYTFTTLMMSFLSLKVIDLIKKPESPAMPFGYTALEPFINLIKSIIMLALLIVFLVTNIQELTTGGRIISLNLTTLYIFICLFIYAIIIFMLRKCGAKSASSILNLEIKNWCIDALMTVGIAVSLVGAMIAMRFGYTQILPYIDPVIVILLVVLSLPLPLKVFTEELRRLLLVSPENMTEIEVKNQIAEVIEKHGLINMQVWGLKSGRTQYLFLYCDLSREKTSVGELDDIRTDIFVSLAKLYPSFWADIMFTRIDPGKPFQFPNPYPAEQAVTDS